jgi:adenylate cyclase
LVAVPFAFAVLLMFNVASLRERIFGVTAATPIKRLAVLPLANLTGDPEQNYLADGIHEALVTELAKISSLQVVSRTSVMRYKKSDKSVPEIAKDLKVDAVVEGALLASGQRVQVTAQLVAANPERHLWADKLDRDARDISALYTDLTRAIARAVKAKLTPQEQARLASARKVDPAVYKLELRGRFYLEKGGIVSNRTEAANFFEKAIQLDPIYAPAYQGLAAAYWGLGLRSSLPPREAYTKAKAAALKAVELDDSLGQAHSVLGRILFLYEWDWEGAEREYQRVRQLDSSWEGPTLFLCLTGRFEEAIAANRRQLEFDPQSPATSHSLGFMYFWAGRYDEAIAQQKRTLQLDPDRPYSRSQIGWAYAKKGMYAEAVAECDAAIRQLGKREDQELIGHCGWVYAVSGRRDKAMEIARRLRRPVPPRWVNPVHLAKIYDGFGERERAIRFLYQAYEERSPLMAHLKTDPMYSDQLRADPRFQELLRRVGPP